MSTTDLIQSAAHELLQFYRSGQASPVDATQAGLTMPWRAAQAYESVQPVLRPKL